MKFDVLKSGTLLSDISIDFFEEITSELEYGYTSFEEIERNFYDRISEYADSFCDTMTSDLLKWLNNCHESFEYMEQAIAEGLTVTNYNYDFYSHLIAAQYCYNYDRLSREINDFENFLCLFNEQTETIGVFNCTNTGSWEIKFISENEVVYSCDNDIEYAAIEYENDEPGFYFTNDWFIKLDEIIRV